MQDESIAIFVKNRAKADFVGYVDVATLAPVSSPASRGMRVFNSLVNVQVPQFGNSLREELTKKLQQLSKATAQELWTFRQILLTEIFPKLEYARDLSAIAAALGAHIPAIRHDAVTRAERLLLLSNYRLLSDAKSTLLSVAQMTKLMLVQASDGDSQMRVYINLHIMSASALLTRSEPPISSRECNSFRLTSQEIKKQRGSRQEVLKVVINFYKHFLDHSKGLSLLKVDRAKKAEEFARKSFCEQIAYIFLLFNEGAQEGWSKRGLDILQELRDLYGALPTAGKYRLTPENSLALDFMVLRSLVLLLTNTFSTVKFEAGGQSYHHAKLAAEMAVQVAKACQEHPGGEAAVAAADLGSLLFHESTGVKRAMNGAVILSLPNLLAFYDKYLTDSLRVADLCLEDVSSTQEGERGQEVEVTGRTCGWHRFSGRLAEGQVEGFVLVHTIGCLTVEDARMCLKSNRLAGHVRHLEMLLRLSPHPNIVQMLAYQINPFPAYVTEQLRGQRLLDHLLSHRGGQRWLDTPTLCRVTLQIVTALEFLHSQGIASRDITAYDMVVVGRRRRGGKAGELIEVLSSEEFTIRLANLALAHQYRKADNKDSIIPVTDQGAIPVLWTSPEALVRGEYSWRSMVYALGCVMYELWTHGSQPFSSLHRSTADTLRQMLTVQDSVTLIHWPCVPDNVYELIRNCTASDPSRRPHLKEVRNVLNEIIGAGTEVKARRRESVTKEDEYPVFSSDQRQRRHVPERGIPRELQEEIARLKTKRYCSSEGARALGWDIYDDSVMKVKISEMVSRECLNIKHQKNNTTVKEHLSPKFAKNFLMPLMMCAPPSGGRLPGVTDWTRAEMLPGDRARDGYVIHERDYPPSWTLKEAAARGFLTDDDEYFSMGPPHFLGVFASAASAVHRLHEKGWLLRDLRASYVLITKDNHQVILCRIGRMMRLASPETQVVEEPFEDSRRWLAPEVLTSGDYTRANDVFMLGTVFWETFRAREIMLKNPSASDLHSVPFASQELEAVSTIVKAGVPLPKTTHCPDELYDLILSCRRCDPSERPSALQVLDALESLMKKERSQDIRTESTASKPLPVPPPLGSKPRSPSAENVSGIYVSLRRIDDAVKPRQTSSNPAVPENDREPFLKAEPRTEEENQQLANGLFPTLAKIAGHFKSKKRSPQVGKSTTDLYEDASAEDVRRARRDLKKHQFKSMPDLFWEDEYP